MLEECEGSDEAMGYTYGIVDRCGMVSSHGLTKNDGLEKYLFFHVFVGVIVLLLGTVLQMLEMLFKVAQNRHLLLREVSSCAPR